MSLSVQSLAVTISLVPCFYVSSVMGKMETPWGWYGGRSAYSL